MCIIAICRDRKLTDEEFHACWHNNSDGAGMAWVEGKKHIIKKGFMDYLTFKELYSTVDTLPHVVHFRIATAGGVIPELTHPFICKKKSPIYLEWEGKQPVLFHNGIVWQWQTLAGMLGISPQNNLWSDTRVLASVLAKWGFDVLEKEGGKYAVLMEGEIKSYGTFYEEDGISFSNYGYDEVWSNVYVGTAYSYGKGWKSKYYNYAGQGYTVVANDCDTCPDGNARTCNFCKDKDNSPYLKANQPYNYCDTCTYVLGSVNCDGCPDNPNARTLSKPKTICELYDICAANSQGSILESKCATCPDNPNTTQVSSTSISIPSTECATCCYYFGHLQCCTCPNNPDYMVETSPSEEHLPFPDCDGDCDECPSYNASNNTCKVFMDYEAKKEELRLIEHKVIDPDAEYEQCADMGEACMSCPSFDGYSGKCSVWN